MFYLLPVRHDSRGILQILNMSISIHFVYSHVICCLHNFSFVRFIVRLDNSVCCLHYNYDYIYIMYCILILFIVRLDNCMLSTLI